MNLAEMIAEHVPITPDYLGPVRCYSPIDSVAHWVGEQSEWPTHVASAIEKVHAARGTCHNFQDVGDEFACVVCGTIGEPDLILISYPTGSG